MKEKIAKNKNRRRKILVISSARSHARKSFSGTFHFGLNFLKATSHSKLESKPFIMEYSQNIMLI